MSEPSEGAKALASIESPLAGVNPRSLDALMAEDPAKLAPGEFDQIISAMRKLREGWIASEQKKDAEGPKAASTRPRAAKGTVNISLDDLL